MKKSTIIILVVIVLAVAAYFYFEGTSPSPAGGSSLVQSDAGSGAVGSDVLGLLNQIQSLSIDPTFFEQPAYQTLRDYSVAIPSEPVGRANPFAPVPGVPDASGSPSPATN